VCRGQGTRKSNPLLDAASGRVQESRSSTNLEEALKKTSAAIAGGIAIAAAAVVGLASPVQAAEPGYLTVFSEPNQQGNQQYFDVGFDNLAFLKYRQSDMSMNDTISSYDNDTNSAWCFYPDAHYAERAEWIGPHSRGNFQSLSEQISSFYRQAPNGFCGQNWVPVD
jgi:hypothetical protein